MKEVIEKIIQMTKGGELYWNYLYETTHNGINIRFDYYNLIIDNFVIDDEYPQVLELYNLLARIIRQPDDKVKKETEIIETIMDW